MEKEQSQNNEQEKPKEDIPLFRQEVLEHKKGSYLGKTIIISPISFSVWALGIFVIAFTLALFLYFGKYAKRQDVIGMLVPNKGLMHVYATAPGIVVDRYVKQGDAVTKGQLLYLISTEHHSLTKQGAVAQQVEAFEKQLKVLNNKIEISEKNLERYKQLLDQKVISEAEYQKLYGEHLNIELTLHDIEQKLIQAKGAEDFALRAPDDGVVTTLVAMVGDRVTQDKLLVTIIPKGAVLRGMLFVRSDTIGFVKIGQKVLLKYDAFPYQNFGLYEAIVESIDNSILSPKDFDLPININPHAVNYSPNEPFYRVFVELKQQTVSVYGKPVALMPGMTLKGSVLGDERRIWQWIMDPIYSLRGSLISK